MFKVSDDLDSDDDFLEKEFTEDFLSSGPRCAGSSKDVSAESSSFDLAVTEGLPKKPCSNSDVTPTFSDKGLKSSTPISRGFHPKTKTSPVLLNSTDKGSSHFRSSPPGISATPLSLTNLHNGSRKDDQILYKNGLTNSTEVSSVPSSSHNSPLSTSASKNVDQRNSAFLAEWNDDSFFNAPQQNQPLHIVRNQSARNHTPDVVTRKVNRSVRQRRFPGPAGLLPPRQGNTSLIAPEEFLIELKSEDSDPTYQETEILSQSSGSVFEGGAWSAMLEDLGTSGQTLLKSMNLASIKAIGRNLRSCKVPFLSVLVQSVDASLADAAVILKDPTGEMHGVIHRDVWDQFSSDIAVGTVLVLRNVGIISAGVSSRKHVVNITGNNLTAIYSPKDELNIELRRIHEFAANTSSKLLAEWEKVESQTANSASPLSRRVQMPPPSSPLFNSFQASGHRSGNVAGNRPLGRSNHNSLGRSIYGPVSPSSSSSNLPRSFNQRNGLMAPNMNSSPVMSCFNKRNVPIAPSPNPSNPPIASSINQRNGPMATDFHPTHRMVPNNEPTDRSSKNTTTAPSISSPFSPMLSRQCGWSTNRTSPVNTNNENSSLAGNQKFVQKSPFTMKAPTTSRPPQPPANMMPQSKFSNPQKNHNPLTTQTISPSVLPAKKPKLSQSVASPATDYQNSTLLKKNPFQVDADTSAIDSLFDGIDTDSLFGEF